MGRGKSRFIANLGRLLVFLSLLSGVSACGPESGLGDIERILHASWRSYARRYISTEGRVVLSERGGESISEAQAYALMRALWAGDEAEFSKVYVWTQGNLSRVQLYGDQLLAWHWGRRENGSWGVLDWNTAADADLDYATALWLAARRGWKPPAPWPGYGAEAKAVARDILAKELVTLPGGELLLAPGNWHQFEPPHLLNPSYFSPAAFHLFGQAGFDERWQVLHNSLYPLLERLCRKLGDKPGVGLFPDWVRLEAPNALAAAPGRDADFGWEALRLPWRVALDRLWFGDRRAARLLGQGFLPVFQKEWQAKGKLAAIYSYAGQPLVDYESPVLYAGVLAAALAADDRQFADRMALKILSFYREEGGEAYFVSPDNYYANNWAWLGLALYAGWVKTF